VRRFLRTPEPARECGLADRAALSWRRVSRRAASATDEVVELLVAVDVATRTRRKLSPTTFEDQIGRRLHRCVYCDRAVVRDSRTMRRLGHAGGEENYEENKGYD